MGSGAISCMERSLSREATGLFASMVSTEVEIQAIV